MFRDSFLSATCHVCHLLPKGRRTLFQAAHNLVGRPQRFVLTTHGFHFQIDTQDLAMTMPLALIGQMLPVPIGLAVLLQETRPGSVVLDIGAHKGWYGLLAAAKAGPTGRVIAYEPDPRNAEDLLETVRLNRDRLNIEAVIKAIGGRPGVAQFDAGAWQRGGSDLGHLVEAGANGEGRNYVDVEVTTLDLEFQRLGLTFADLVKVDIEGAECQAVTGMRETLAKKRIGTLLLELHDKFLTREQSEEVVHSILAAGYAGFFMEQAAFNDQEVQMAIDGRAQLQWEGRATPAEKYSYAARAHNPHRQPPQFVFYAPRA